MMAPPVSSGWAVSNWPASPTCSVQPATAALAGRRRAKNQRVEPQGHRELSLPGEGQGRSPGRPPKHQRQKDQQRGDEDPCIGRPIAGRRITIKDVDLFSQTAPDSTTPSNRMY